MEEDVLSRDSLYLTLMLNREHVLEVTSLNGVSTLSDVYNTCQCNCIVFLPSIWSS